MSKKLQKVFFENLGSCFFFDLYFKVYKHLKFKVTDWKSRIISQKRIISLL